MIFRKNDLRFKACVLPSQRKNTKVIQRSSHMPAGHKQVIAIKYIPAVPLGHSGSGRPLTQAFLYRRLFAAPPIPPIGQ